MTTETTMEMETTETTVEMTTETTTTSTLLPNIFPKSTGGSRSQTGFPYATVFSGTNTTNFKFGNHSMGNATSNSTVAPVHSIPAIPHVNTTSNSSSWVPHFSINGSSASPTVDGSTRGNGSTSAQVFPTQITSEGSTAPRQTPTRGGPNPSKTTAQLPAAVQLLVHVPLSFRIINRSFNESLRDPASEEYRSLSSTVLTMVSPSPTSRGPGLCWEGATSPWGFPWKCPKHPFCQWLQLQFCVETGKGECLWGGGHDLNASFQFERVFGCLGCMGTQTYTGCSELQYR